MVIYRLQLTAEHRPHLTRIVQEKATPQSRPLDPGALGQPRAGADDPRRLNSDNSYHTTPVKS